MTFTKTYTIGEIVTRGGQLNGDYKARTVAIAFDDQFKEFAYNKDGFTFNYDNEGNSSKAFFDETLGNSHYVSKNSLSAEDINNPDRCYTLEFQVPGSMSWHVVAIVGADKDYVYIQDPNGINGVFNETDENYDEETGESNESGNGSEEENCGIEKMTCKQFRQISGLCIYANLN